MKILLFGKDGQVGRELGRSLAPLGELRALGHRDADLLDLDALRACVRALEPDIIVNAAAYTAVDRAETDEALAHRINALAPGLLAEEAAACGAWLVHYSTDYVFDGRKPGTYIETDAANPLSAYGRSKFEGEERVRASGARHLILRTGWVFGRHGANFPKTILRLARERTGFDVVADQSGAPTSAELLADATALALQRIALAGDAAPSLSGTYHLTAAGHTTWHAYAVHVVGQALARGARLQATRGRIVPVAASDWGAAAARPANSLLDTGKFRNTFGLALPDWRYHIDRLIAELAEQGNP
ncbi:dTDP-4-dehydrorhamnose reductase [Telluria aromaticivorans]|uniref:dTDP-4-dehydrorhamnose reductase n=1 Tax=Telluria aromaticivorans TaxID=2725995 RepID=A0A7Y2JX69_9BURK|nr:dTDP-4-dehydrorhamnose reductase [Telluria aromaticivorans]NNG22672.1 dTDP-4-dehydrorhamnose reductase [Telluria aromaticivorans]